MARRSAVGFFGPHQPLLLENFTSEGNAVLWSIISILVLLWLIAVVAKFTLGGLIHLLLIIAFVVLIFRLLTGRSAPIA